MPITVLIVDDSKLARIVAGKVVTVLQPDWRSNERLLRSVGSFV